MNKALLASILLLAALVPYSVASWTYLGLVGTVHGIVEPGGILQRFNIDVGAIYSGMSKSVNASARIVMPQSQPVKFYGVEDSVVKVNYSVMVFLDDYSNLLGSFSSTENLTTTIPAGEHILLFIIRIDAPVVSEPLNFTIQVYMVAG